VTWAARLTVLAYVIFAGSTLTALYDPLYFGRGQDWAVLVLVVAAQIGAGAGIAHMGALLLPVAAAIAAYAVRGDHLYGFFFVAAAIFGMALVALGIGLARASHRGTVIAAVAFALATPVFVWGAVETIDRSDAPHAPAELKSRLPLELHLANLCPGSATPERLASRLETQARTLIREVDRHPDWLVPYTYASSDFPDEHKELTIEEFAEEELELYEVAGQRCEGGYQTRLRAALE
jgi:hypothetical protein